jgi:hypothetical protein
MAVGGGVAGLQAHLRLADGEAIREIDCRNIAIVYAFIRVEFDTRNFPDER